MRIHLLVLYSTLCNLIYLYNVEQNNGNLNFSFQIAELNANPLTNFVFHTMQFDLFVQCGTR